MKLLILRISICVWCCGLYVVLCRCVFLIRFSLVVSCVLVRYRLCLLCWLKCSISEFLL